MGGFAPQTVIACPCGSAHLVGREGALSDLPPPLVVELLEGKGGVAVLHELLLLLRREDVKAAASEHTRRRSRVSRIQVTKHQPQRVGSITLLP